MTQRSTRNRLRGQVQAVVNDLDRAMEHLRNVDLYADGGSDKITKELPKLVAMLSGIKDIFVRWRSEL
ncbi:hypothetical protein LCGC14_1605860 [marine sediment metagenome]|uniref:Uncharacterized protein n=1 Tax=marine sediment metagenome TaxID=412755 RepID=A0A0F9L9Q0_9ZZZZ